MILIVWLQKQFHLNLPHLTISFVISFEFFFLSSCPLRGFLPLFIEVISSRSSRVSLAMGNHLQTSGPLRLLGEASFLCFVDSILLSSRALCDTQDKPETSSTVSPNDSFLTHSPGSSKGRPSSLSALLSWVELFPPIMKFFGSLNSVR